MPAFNYVSGNPSNLTAGGAANMADLQGPFTDLRSALNGNLDEVNVPNLTMAFTTYKTILFGGGLATNGAVTGGGTYFLSGGPISEANNVVATTASAYSAFHLDPTDFNANTRTTKLRLKVACVVNGAAPTTNIVPGLYPVSSFGGGSGATPTISALGTVISGSTVVFTTPGASSATTQTSGDFNFPATGFYVLAMVAGGGFAAGSQVALTLQLQMRQV